MQQHPIPQNVTAYEFHLIGNMTIKQFLELGAGVGMAMLFYATNLPDFIKWPLILVSVMLGGALAFLPFDGRPLDRVIIAFFKAVYSPTQYIWRKTPIIPAYFNYSPQTKTTDHAAVKRHEIRKNLNEYLQTLPRETQTDPFDDHESKYLYDVTQLFQTVPAAKGVTASTQLIIPTHPSIRIRKIKPASKLPSRGLDYSIKANSISVPQNQPVHFNQPNQNSTPVSQKPVTTASDQSLPTPSHQIASNTQQPLSITQATHNKNLPFPSLPDTPNTLVGMVLDHYGRIVENAIIEVKDDSGMPIRALKSNKLGQFFSATPLADGQYHIEVDKDQLDFPHLQLKLHGKVVPPLEIRAST